MNELMNAHDAYENRMADPAAHARFPLILSVYIPVFLVAEIGNAFVIYSLARLKYRERTAIDCYILNLAIADILITTLSLFNAAEYLKNEWKLYEGMCKIHGAVMEACYIVSTFTLLTISYSRRKAASNTFRVLDAKKTVKRNIFMIWSAAFVLTSPLSYAYTVADRNGRLHCSNTNFDEMSRQIYYLVQAVFTFFLPVLVMLESQKKISKGLRRHSKIYCAAMQHKNAHWKRVMAQEKRVSKFLTWLWGFFVFCFAPNITLRTIDHFISIRRRSEIWNQIWHVSQTLALLNSAINPFLYYRTTNWDRSNVNKIVEIFCCLRQKRKPSLSKPESKQRSQRKVRVVLIH